MDPLLYLVTFKKKLNSSHESTTALSYLDMTAYYGRQRNDQLLQLRTCFQAAEVERGVLAATPLPLILHRRSFQMQPLFFTSPSL